MNHRIKIKELQTIGSKKAKKEEGEGFDKSMGIKKEEGQGFHEFRRS